MWLSNTAKMWVHIYLECLLNFDLGDLRWCSSLWRVAYRSRCIRRIRSWGLGELRTSLTPVNEVLLEYSVVVLVIPSKSDNSLRSVSDSETVGKTNVKGWSPRTTDSLCSLITLDFEVLLFEFLLTLKKYFNYHLRGTLCISSSYPWWNIVQIPIQKMKAIVNPPPTKIPNISASV